MTDAIKAKILETTYKYGTGRDTLRCLGLAMIENPMRVEDMDLADSNKFIQYEVNATFIGVCGMLGE